MYDVRLYSRQDLKLGNHELKIVNMNGTGTNVLWLSYFLVDTSPASSSVTSASSSQSSTSLKSSASISIFASSSSSASSSASPEATSSTSQSFTRGKTAAIAGGVVGGVALLVLLGILLFLLWRRRCKQVGEKGKNACKLVMSAEVANNGVSIKRCSAIHRKRDAGIYRRAWIS